MDGDSAQVVRLGPQSPGVFPRQVSERGRVGEYVEEVLAAKEGADPFDGEPERVGEVVEINVAFAAWEHAGYPDPLPDEIGQGDQAGQGLVPGIPSTQLERPSRIRG